MPRKPKYSKDELVSTAVQIVREEGYDALTARNLVGRLGTAPATIFTHFDSMESLENAARSKAFSIYNGYVEEGFRMNPPFKGFGVRLVEFALEEPNLFYFLFQTGHSGLTMEMAARNEGHVETLVPMVKDTFGLDDETAFSIFMDLWTYSIGLASVCASGVQKFTDEEIAGMLGRVCRGLVLNAKNPDARTGIIPSETAVTPDLAGYLGKS